MRFRKKNLYKYKKHFIFNKEEFNIFKTGILVYKRTYSNIFITFTDLKNKVVITKSSGNVKAGYSKKKKTSVQAIELIVKSLIKILRIYKIAFVRIILKVRISVHVFNLVRLLAFYGIRVSFFRDLKKIAHNGLWSRNKRRI